MALIQCAAESGTASFPIILHPVLHPNSTERCTARAPSEGAHRLPERASLRCSPLFFSSRSLSAEDLIIHSGTDTEQTTVTHRSPASVAKWLSTARAAYTHAQTHYSSLNCAAIVDGRRGQLIVRTKSLARFFVVLRDARAGAACVDCCAGSGPRAPLLLRESTRIKGDKAGIRKQRPHATVASPPSVRPRHVRRTS